MQSIQNLRELELENAALKQIAHVEKLCKGKSASDCRKDSIQYKQSLCSAQLE